MPADLRTHFGPIPRAAYREYLTAADQSAARH
jgi:hypothetical protein